MRRFRLPLRLASRSLRARPWRTLLVATFIAVPVAGMVVSAVVVRSHPGDPQWLDYGRADLVVHEQRLPGDLPVRRFDPEATFPGSTSARLSEVWARWRTEDGRRATIRAEVGDVDHPITEGVVQLVNGRLPVRSGEVALSPKARRDLGVRGDVLRLDRPAMTLRVVGTAVEPWSYNASLLVLHDLPTGSFPPELLERRTLIDLPGDPSPEEITAAGAVVEEAGYPFTIPFRDTFAPRNDSRQAPLNWSYVVGSLVLLVLSIVIAAAFAVGARRQLRTLGLLAANGASPGTVRDVLLVEGALSGMAGVVLGGVLATAALIVAAPHRNRLLDRVTDGWVVRPLDLVPIAILGIGAAVLASVQPARSASRLSVLQALAGQRPAGRVPGWAVPVGLAGFAGGVALLSLAVLGSQSTNGDDSVVWTLTAIAGGVGVVLGGTALAPAVLQRLEPAAGRLRGTWRLAARSLARSRARSSAVVAALAAAAALTVAVSAVVQSIDVDDRRNEQRALPDDVVLVSTQGFDRRPGLDVAAVRRVAETVDATDWVQFRSVELNVMPRVDSAAQGMSKAHGGSPALATPELTRFLGLDQRQLDALDQGQLVLLDDGSAPDDTTVPLTLQVWTEGAEQPRELDVEGVVASSRFPLGWALPSVLVPADQVEAIDAPIGAESALVEAPRPLSDVDRDALGDLRDDLADEALDRGELAPYSGLNLAWESPNRSVVAPIQAGLVGAALVFTLIVLAVGLGLSAAESKAERDVLVAVGAAPRSTRRLAGAKAATLAVVGSALALPMALVPVAAWARATEPDMPFRFPVAVIVVLLVAVPAVAFLLTWACSAAASRVRPVRASTFAAD